MILDRNPLKVEPEALWELVVVETIKEAGTVFDWVQTSALTVSLCPYLPAIRGEYVHSGSKTLGGQAAAGGRAALLSRRIRAPIRRRPGGHTPLTGRDRIPNLVPVRRDRMGESPYAFYRAGAKLMATDLATTPPRT